MEEDTGLIDGPPIPVHERYFTNFYHVIRGEKNSTIAKMLAIVVPQV
jgi:hypothetical protein